MATSLGKIIRLACFVPIFSVAGCLHRSDDLSIARDQRVSWSHCQLSYRIKVRPLDSDQPDAKNWIGDYAGFEGWSGAHFLIASNRPIIDGIEIEPLSVSASLDPRSYDSIHFSGREYVVGIDHSQQDGFKLRSLGPPGPIPNLGNSLQDLLGNRLLEETPRRKLTSSDPRSAQLEGIPCREFRFLEEILHPDGRIEYQDHTVYLDPSDYRSMGGQVRYASTSDFEEVFATEKYRIQYREGENRLAPSKITTVYSGNADFTREYVIDEFRFDSPSPTVFQLSHYGIPEPDMLDTRTSPWMILMGLAIVILVASILRAWYYRTSTRPLQSGGERSGFTLVELVIVLSILGVLVSLLIPAVQSAREVARKASCQNNLRNIALASLNCESATGRLPGPMLNEHPNSGNYTQDVGLFIGLLPYLDLHQFYQRFDLSGTCHASVNAPLLKMRPAVLKCPSAGESEMLHHMASEFSGPAMTGIDGLTCDYAGNHGVLSHFRASRLGSIRIRIGTLAREHRLREMLDGTSHTLMVWETVGDGLWLSEKYRVPLDTQCPTGFFYLVAGVPGATLVSTTQSSYKTYLASWSGFRVGSIQEDDPVLINYSNGSLQPFSSHRDTLPVAFVDGRVQTLSTQVDRNALIALAASQDGEVVELP